MEDIKSKIRALMAKTIENGCTEEEAIAASKKVQDMLFKYQLSLTDLKLREESNCRTGKYDYKSSAIGPLDLCIAAVAYFTDTKAWREKFGGDDGRVAYKYFGLDADVMIAEYVTKVLDWAIIWAGEDFKRSEIYANSLKRSKVLLDFRNAMAVRLSSRLRKMKDDQKVASNGRDLVVIKSSIVTEEFAKLNMKLKSGKQKKMRDVNAAAWAAGVAAGDSVAISPGINASNGAQGELE